MTIACKVNNAMGKASWIPRMFEEGARLKARHGVGNVFDFSLGNPALPPPGEFGHALMDIVSTCGPGSHCYMPQPGHLQVCEAVAAYLAKEQGVAIGAGDVIMTCGGAGALNVILKALLDPGDEVIAPSPCFMGYHYYVDNHGGVIQNVACRDDFTLDLEAIAGAINAKTKAVLINSPNNPTGQIYSAESLKALGDLLAAKSRAMDRIIYLLSDEPYRKIVFDGQKVPSIFNVYEQSIVAGSYSMELSIPGERIGFAAVHPAAIYKREIMGAMAMTIRILGFVNAPSLMQRVVADLQGVSVDIDAYRHKRDLLCEGLADAGYDFDVPPGAFYLFPRTPIEDDMAFVQALEKELILTVPGSSFQGAGHFRIAYCVDDDTIVNAMPGFKRVMEKYK
ncbi:MAG: pyridoxal phosphate-dependent aminotransferase [Desulfobacteraceae bacterium]